MNFKADRARKAKEQAEWFEANQLKMPAWMERTFQVKAPPPQWVAVARRELERWRDMKRNRPRCGASRKSDGQPCQAPCFKRKDGTVAKRCRLHGGASTGPKSPEGKAVALANLRQNKTH